MDPELASIYTTHPEVEYFLRPSPHDSQLIYRAFTACMDGFTSLIDVVQQKATDEAPSDTHNTSDTIKVTEAITIQKTRLSNWMAAIDAFRRNRPFTSQENYLGHASHVQDQVLQLLQDLEEEIMDATSIICGNTPLEIEFEAIDDLPGLPYDTELSQILAHMAEILDCLNRLTLSIRHPAPHDQVKMASILPTLPTVPRDLFPGRPECVQEMIQKAMTRLLEHFLSIKVKAHDDDAQRSFAWKPDNSWSLAFSMLSRSPDNNGTTARVFDRCITIEAIDLVDGGRALERNDERFIASISLSLSEQDKDVLTKFLACPEEDASELLSHVLPAAFHETDRLSQFLTLGATERKILAEFLSLSPEDKKMWLQRPGLSPLVPTYMARGRGTNLSGKLKGWRLPFPPRSGNLSHQPIVVFCPHCSKSMSLRKPREGLSAFITRHVIGEHQPFFCFSPDCSGTREFYSQAEWEAHFRMCSHVSHRCLIPECTYLTEKADLLAAHINGAHQNDLAGKEARISTLVEMGRVITPMEQRNTRCPLCGWLLGSFPHYKLHMRNHHISLASAALLIISGEDPGSETVLGMLRA